MKNLDLNKLNNEIEAFVSERDWDQFHSVKNLSMALSVEASELVEIFQWMKEEDSNLIKGDPKTLGQVQDELADIFYYLLRMSAKLDVDLGDALSRKMLKNAQKYPVEASRGNSKKYNEL